MNGFPSRPMEPPVILTLFGQRKSFLAVTFRAVSSWKVHCRGLSKFLNSIVHLIEWISCRFRRAKWSVFPFWSLVAEHSRNGTSTIPDER